MQKSKIKSTHPPKIKKKRAQHLRQTLMYMWLFYSDTNDLPSPPLSPPSLPTPRNTPYVAPPPLRPPPFSTTQSEHCGIERGRGVFFLKKNPPKKIIHIISTLIEYTTNHSCIMVVFNFTQKGAKFTDDTYTVSTSRLYIHLSHLSSPHTYTHTRLSQAIPLMVLCLWTRKSSQGTFVGNIYKKSPWVKRSRLRGRESLICGEACY